MIRISLPNYLTYILTSLNFFLIYFRLVLSLNYELILIKICTYSVYPGTLGTLHNSVNLITQYPIFISEFCLREIDEQ